MSIVTGNAAVASDFVSTSSGAGDSGKVNKLNASGKNPVDFNGFEGVRAKQNSGGSVGTSPAAIPFQAEDFDTDAFHDNVTNNTRLTVPAGKGGKYLIIGLINSGTASSAALSAYILLNGTTAIGTANGGGHSGLHGVCVSTVYTLVAGDYIELFGAVSSSTFTTSGDQQTAFSMVRLSA
jgi:hypothetical protein